MTAGAGAPKCRRNRTAVTDERSRLRRVQLKKFMSLLAFSIAGPSLVTACPGHAASNGAAMQRVPITTTASTPGLTIYDATGGIIQ